MFSTVYNQSFQFLKLSLSGLSRFTDFLFLTLRDIIADALNTPAEDFFPDVQFLGYSVFSFVIGGGILLYLGIALWKFIQDAIL